MNIIKILITLLAILSLNGCTQHNLQTPSLKTLHDAELKVTKDGGVKLKTTYTFKDGNTTQKIEDITKPIKKVNSKGYEVLPNFDKKYDTNLAIKKKYKKIDQKIVLKGKKVKISVEAIPVNEFIDLVFSNLLKLNYTVTPEVSDLKTPITLNMTTLQPKQEVFEVVTKLLALNGITLKKENGVIFLFKKDKASSTLTSQSIYIGYGRKVKDSIPDQDQILMFITFEHIKPKKSIYILQLAGISKSVYYYPSNNVMMVKNTAGEVRRILNVLALIDRPYMESKSTWLLELKHIDVENFSTRMRAIFSANDIQVVNSPTSNGVVLNSIPELNGLFVISPKKEWLDMILYWKNKLDVDSGNSPDPKFYTYVVKNRKADELAEALNQVMDIKLSKPASETKEPNQKGIKKVGKKDVIDKNANHSIKFDLQTNILMMQLLPSEYRELLPLIEELDALPKQVLVEVTFAEVTLTDTFNLGFEYALQNNAAAGATPLVNALVTSAFGGSGFAATYNSKNLDATINAYAEDKLLSIMSKPKLLILNNETGNINIGTQIPIITSEASATDITGTTPSILRNVSYRDTGVVVGITPTINSNGVLTMSVNLQLSEAQLNDTSTINSPLIVNRSLATSLTLHNGQSVLLGGLISKNKSNTDSGVPWLRDIPLLGEIFKSQSDKVVKTELIILIKPFIIENPEQMNDKTRKYKSMLKLLNEYSIL